MCEVGGDARVHPERRRAASRAASTQSPTASIVPPSSAGAAGAAATRAGRSAHAVVQLHGLAVNRGDAQQRERGVAAVGAQARRASSAQRLGVRPTRGETIEIEVDHVNPKQGAVAGAGRRRTRARRQIAPQE